jgi:mRNA interferase RelE/StbE
MKTLLFITAAAKQMAKLPKAISARIADKLGRYAKTGEGDVVAIKGTTGVARLRVGDYRAVFAETDTEVTVLKVGHRKDIYE